MHSRIFQLITVLASLLAFAPQLFGQAGGAYDAPKRTMSIDGDLSDWFSNTDHGILSHSFTGDGSDAPVSLDIRYAWDDDNLYTMVIETTVDDDIVEGANREDWVSGPDSTGPASPWGTDSVGFYDAPANEIGYPQTGPKTQWWVGLSSDAADDEQIRHLVREAPEDDATTELITGQAANFFEGDIRGVEFFMAWDDIRYDQDDPFAVIGHTRQDVEVGYTFRLDPLLVDGVGDGSEFHSQSYPGGSTNPALVALEDTSFVVLIGGDAPLNCDFDGNGACDEADINRLMNDAETGGTSTDLNNDGVVNDMDRDEWLAMAGPENGFADSFLVGDSDLNGTIEAGDLNNLALAWQDETKLNWTDGNYTIGGGPGVRVNDLNAMAVNWQQTVPAAAAAEAVPEPSTVGLLLGALLLFACRKRFLLD
jgi:hypothetical protein